MKIDLPTESLEPRRDSLSTWQRLLIDGISILIALTSIPLALTYRDWNPFELREGLVVLAVMLIMAVPATGLLTVILRLSSISRGSLPIHATRLAARSAVLIVVLAGGIFVLVAVFRSRGFLSEAALSAHPYTLWLAVALSFIPVVAFASLLGLLFSLLLRPRVDKGTVVIRNSEEESESGGKGVGILYGIALVGATACLASPFFLPWWPKAEPIPVADTPAPPERFSDDVSDPSEKAPSDQTTQREAFSYLEPQGFDTAPSSQWRVQIQKVIPNVNDRSPVMMSPDGRFLAFTSRDEPDSLILFDLNRFAVHSTYPNMNALRELAWSPESDFLFCLTQQERSFSYVIRIEQKKRLALPLRQEAKLPVGQPFWWEDFEIAFLPSNGSALFLDLVDLRIRPIAESRRWRKLMEDSSSGEVSPPELELTESSRVRLTAAPRIISYRAPGYQQVDWDFISETVLAIEDKKLPIIQTDFACPIVPGDRIASSTRSMKVVRLRQSEALITYFTLGYPTPPFVEAKLPERVNLEKNEAFKALLLQHRLCAFICAPRTNPITGQVVGPDRERVKALARWGEERQGSARFWIAENYAPLEKGDVIADLHLWEDRELASCDHPFGDRWWAEISLPESEEEPSPPSMAPLDRISRAEFQSSSGTLQLKGLAYPVLKATKAQMPQVSPQPRKGTVTDPLPQEPRPPLPEDAPVEDRVREFVRQHYQKLENKNFDAYLEDYTDFIVYYGRAGKKTENLRSAVLSLRSTKSIEAVLSENISVRGETSDQTSRYAVSYEVTLTRTDLGGKTTTQRSRVKLGVFLIGNTIRIVEENGTPLSPSSR